MKPSLTLVCSGIFIAYVLHSVYTIYSLFTPPKCQKRHDRCIDPYLQNNPKLLLALFTSTKSVIHSANELSTLWQFEDFNIQAPAELTVNLSLPRATRNNGSLYVHAFLTPKFQTSQTVAHIISSAFSSYASASLTAYIIPEAETFKLLSSTDDKGNTNAKSKLPKMSSASVPVAHFRKKLLVSVMADVIPIPHAQVPGEIVRYLRLSPQDEYLPILYIDTLSTRVRDFQILEPSNKQIELIIAYSPMSFGKLRFSSQVETAMHSMISLGFTEKDLDEIKGVFMDTNLTLLCLTFIVAALHLLFDFLAFKNDVSFWRRRKNMVGLSTRSLLWRCGSQFVVFLYLMDEDTSMLVLVPAGIGTVIEIWKLTRAFKVKINFNRLVPKFEFGETSEEEKKTELYDAQSMKYLSFLLYPLCAGGAIYSLLYMPHKGWYSWCVQSLVNGVYAFGFIFMLPQLFVNYKHKSVAHLPWKAFMYKAFNTFIDDVFAFIITMPTAHRVACFRDDIVFLIYLYQRWLYPVDKSRVNEFGESFEDEINKNEIKRLKKD